MMEETTLEELKTYKLENTDLPRPTALRSILVVMNFYYQEQNPEFRKQKAIHR